MTKLAAAQVRKEFADVVNRTAYAKERIVITKSTKPVVAMIPIEDLELLQALEDKIDLAAAKKALQESKKKGTIPWAQLKKELDLK